MTVSLIRNRLCAGDRRTPVDVLEDEWIDMGRSFGEEGSWPPGDVRMVGAAPRRDGVTGSADVGARGVRGGRPEAASGPCRAGGHRERAAGSGSAAGSPR